METFELMTLMSSATAAEENRAWPPAPLTPLLFLCQEGVPTPDLGGRGVDWSSFASMYGNVS